MSTATVQRGVLLRAALKRMCRATGLPVTFGGVVVPGGRSMPLTEFVGIRTDALSGLVIGAGNGLGGRVLVTARPGSVNDYAADSKISHEYDTAVTAEGLRAIAAVPVMVGESVFGVLYSGIRESLSLGTRVLDTMDHTARRVGLQLAVEEQVERRLAEIETATVTRAAREAPSAPQWEQVREAHAELRSIAQEITDPVLRERIQRVCDRLTRSTDRQVLENPLSPRELDVLALVAVGCGNAEAARRLGLRPETVKSYLSNAMHKLGAHSRMDAVIAARRTGVLP
ncbi:LuxR C-terminal-related transcriptional regulator [Actinoallomurus sp. CA-150999]|uniref:helix-turn-helix transcriptional regulator n=1 Tax=Actinoallomurus sp. CA-150999 TaxID=3239887 RepID=UPI003D8A220B